VWSYTSVPHIFLRDVQRDNFTVIVRSVVTKTLVTGFIECQNELAERE
jgi:hypothetical protein